MYMVLGMKVYVSSGKSTEFFYCVWQLVVPYILGYKLLISMQVGTRESPPLSPTFDFIVVSGDKIAMYARA